MCLKDLDRQKATSISLKPLWEKMVEAYSILHSKSFIRKQQTPCWEVALVSWASEYCCPTDILLEAALRSAAYLLVDK